MCTLIKNSCVQKSSKDHLFYLTSYKKIIINRNYFACFFKKVVDIKFYNLGKIYSFSMDRNLIDKQIYEIITWLAF